MSLRIWQLILVVALFIGVGIAAAVGVQNHALNKLKVNGPIYVDVVGGKDLIADILPPPMFLVESYLLANEAKVHPELAGENIARIAELRKEYDQRREYWRSFPLREDLRLQLESEVLPKADAVWATLEGPFVAALESGTGVAGVLNDLRDKFHQHRAAVVTLVEMSSQFLTEKEGYAAASESNLARMSMIAGFLTLVCCVIGACVVWVRALLPLGRMSNYMLKLAAGDYGSEVPYPGRKDEIGEMARSIGVLRQAGIDNRRLEEENHRAQERTEKERAARLTEREREAGSLAVVVRDLGAGLERLADCNISQTLDEPFAEQFEPLRHDFNNSIGLFQATLEEVLDQTKALQSGASDMHMSADSLAQRSEQQAAALEQASAALEEITATIRSSTEKILQTRGFVGDARDSALASQEVVQNAVEAMRRIEAASRRIATVVSVIDEIAFQTNLLALNAGVEAARAGEAGRGFAVVAQEVRELAQRSATAANEIGDIIRASAGEVEMGVRYVGEAGEALSSITGFVTTIDANVDEIARAAHEQTTGIEQINISVNELDRMTQQNAGMVGETTSVSEMLADNARVLATLVERFKLDGRGRREVSGSSKATTRTDRRAA